MPLQKNPPPAARSKSPEREEVSSAQSSALQTRLGVIESVQMQAGFVLIHIGTAPAPEAGTRLLVYAGATPHAELVVSDHQKRPYLIADIVRGQPEIGDRVAMDLSNHALPAEKTPPGEMFPKADQTPKQMPRE